MLTKQQFVNSEYQLIENTNLRYITKFGDHSCKNNEDIAFLE